jgi:hypothetical protein
MLTHCDRHFYLSAKYKMNIEELDSYNLADTVKFHDRLNPRLWDSSEHLLPEVKAKLMEVAQDFQEFLGVPDLDVKDITISGSNAAFNYTPGSDIDLHIVVDIPDVEHDEVYRELFNAKKYQYNDEHDIRIRGADVELYAQDSKQPHHSQGIYSLLRNAWISVPKRNRAEVDDVSTRSKFEDLAARIDDTVKTHNVGRMNSLMKKIKTMRQSGLEQQGEFGSDNLAFKLLRNNGYIKKLLDARQTARDLELSLAELHKPTQPVVYGFMSESPDGVDPTTKMFLEEPVEESPDGVNPTTAMFLTEVDTESVVQEFIQNTADRLGIEHIPEIVIHQDQDWSESNHSFGMYVPDQHKLHVSLGDRHLLDILRTTAHELCHCAQHESAPLPDNAGDTGSAWENEANAVAGVIMRDFANAHPEYFQQDAIKESASGYIPTRAQAKDPRYSMALTVDIKPGQVGREANKLNLKTDRQGRPALLMKTANLQESLAREFALYEQQDLFEINMGSKNLRKEAAKTGAIAGMEFEMIVPNVEGGDDDAEPEPDWDYDESVNNISDAVDFFDDSGQNSRRDLERLRERMQEGYEQWLTESFDTRWDGDESEFVYNYIKENASADEIAEILGTEPGDYGEYPEPDRQAYRDATEKVVAEGYSNYWYNQAREDAQEDFNRNADQESEWLADQEINTMQDVMNTFGTVDWPHWNTPGTGGDRSIEDVANEFQDAIGRDVRASGNYHSGGVTRPSPTAQHYIVEPDGSLEADDNDDVGLEFVSPPLPIDEILGDLNKVKAWAKQYGCYTNDSTGLHINISVPNYSRENLDFVKLALLMGDEYVLELFGRTGNTFAKPAIKLVSDQVRQKPDEAKRLLEKMKSNLDGLASKAIHSGATSKYTSINTKDGHIEFRSPGGDWLGDNFDQIENTLLRFTVALSAALNPEMYREEYLKKLYKLLTQDDKGSDTIKYFSEYVAGKIPAAALRSFVKQAQLERKLQQGDTQGKKYWWDVSWGNGRVEVVATTKEEAIETAFKESYWAPDEPDTPQAKQFKGSLRAKPLSPYNEPLIKEPTGDAELDGIHQELGLQAPERYEIYNRQTGNSVEDAPARVTNDAEAITHINDYFEHGPHGLQPSQAARMFSIRTVRRQTSPTAPRGREYQIFDQNSQQTAAAFLAPSDEAALARLLQYQRSNPDDPYGVRTANGVEVVDIDMPMAQGRVATSPTGQWKIVDGLNRELYRFRPAENTRAKANELAALWARENDFDGNYQVDPTEESQPGSTADLAQQRAVPGTFTGAWQILDADGNEMHRFSGIGNNQRDANRWATQWVQNNGYAYGTEIEVVPIMSESIAEARSNPDQNPKPESGMKELQAVAETIADPENWAVSMTWEPKLGINPQAAVSEDTPKGIYFYPLDYAVDMARRGKSLPWGDNMPYIQLFQYDRSGEMTKQTQVDPARLKQAVGQYCSEEIMQQAAEENDYDGTPYWFIYDCLSRLGKSDETNIVRWNKVLRDLGFTSVFDDGGGWIAYNEPTQGVVLDPRIIKQHKTINNKKRSRVVTPAVIEQAIFDTLDIELAADRAWQAYDPGGTKLRAAAKEYAKDPKFKPWFGKPGTEEIFNKAASWGRYGARELSQQARTWYKEQQVQQPITS